VYYQLLSGPVRACKVSFPTNRVGPGQPIKVVVTRYRSGTEHETGHTGER
jgi:hypothetical protein